MRIQRVSDEKKKLQGSGLQAFLVQTLGLSALHADQIARAFDLVPYSLLFHHQDGTHDMIYNT